jgi:signal transduction histidine kinase
MEGTMAGDARESPRGIRPAFASKTPASPRTAERTAMMSGRFSGLTMGALLIDGAVATAVGALVIMLSAGTAGVVELPFMAGAVVVSAAVLFLRRLWPWPVLVTLTVITSGLLAAGYPAGPAIGLVTIAISTVSQRTSWWRSLAAGGMALCGILPAYLARAEHSQEIWGAVSLIAMALLMPAVLPVAVRLRRESVARAHAEGIRRHVEEERLEIAREVHDVLGHALAVISMQAGVALHVHERRPGQVHDALQAIDRTSRETLDELDVTFGVFRRSQEAVANRPDLGLDQLGTLLAMLRRIGLEVNMINEGPRTPLPPEVEQAAYRIVQESLTNVLHHAGPVHATVELCFEPSVLSLRISNDGGPARIGSAGTHQRPSTGGNGIPGMRRRASALGGTLQAGPRAGGGFLVAARLPLEDCFP